MNSRSHRRLVVDASCLKVLSAFVVWVALVRPVADIASVPIPGVSVEAETSRLTLVLKVRLVAICRGRENIPIRRNRGSLRSLVCE